MDCYKVVILEKLAANDQIDRRFNIDPSGLSVPALGLYIHSFVYDHYYQTSSKPLAQSKPILMWSFLGKRGHKFVETALVTWPRWPPCLHMGKPQSPMILKVGMQHWGLKRHNVLFMSKSNLVAYVITWKIVTTSFNGKALQQMIKFTKDSCF